MRRAVLVLLLLLAGAATQAAPQTVRLLIKVTVVDADGQVHPVPRHALLISDNPATAAPQRVVTAADGTADARLRPGNYTIESDEPLVFHGRSYEWTETIEVPAGHDTLLELTASKAQIGTASAAPAASVAAGTASALLADWQDSIVWIWSPTRLGSGFLADARGLILTNQRIVGDAAQVEVQLSPTSKVAARVLVSDANHNVAVLWVDPKAVAGLRPMTLGSIAERDKAFAIDAPYHDRKSLTSGTVSRATAHTIVSDVRLDGISAGVPLQNAAGEAVAITTPGDDATEHDDVSTAAVRIDDARPAIAEAETKMRGASPPSAAALPIEPDRPFDDDALRELVKSRAGSLAPYHVAATDFDVYFITPVHLYAERHQPERAEPGGRSGGRSAEQMEALLSPVRDFENWTDYVADYPPVVMVRVVPKFVESLWTTIARGAAQTQGVSIPAIKHLKTSLRSLQLQCGRTPVTPIHALSIVRQLPGSRSLGEPLHVFDAGSIGPQCDGVTITLVSEKSPGKPDTRVVDPKILQQIQADFAPWRAAGR